MKAYFGMENPPVQIVKFAIGDGSIGSDIETELMPMVNSCLIYRETSC